jgi:hypothetical protein
VQSGDSKNHQTTKKKKKEEKKKEGVGGWGRGVSKTEHEKQKSKQRRVTDFQHLIR